MKDFPQIEDFTSCVHRVLKSPQVIVFGSRLLGTHRPQSDVDLVVLAGEFDKIGLQERRKLIAPAVLDLGWRWADIFMRTPAEWERCNAIRNIVESQVHEGETWRHLLRTYGKRLVVRTLDKYRYGDRFTADDIAKELSAVTPFQAVPHSEWPAGALLVEKFAAVGDRGVGDTVCRRLGKVGEAVKSELAAMGFPCRCDKRRDEWNLRYPYAAPTPSATKPLSV